MTGEALLSFVRLRDTELEMQRLGVKPFLGEGDLGGLFSQKCLCDKTWTLYMDPCCWGGEQALESSMKRCLAGICQFFRTRFLQAGRKPNKATQAF